MMSSRPLQKGFTLVELMVVIVIVGLIITLIMQGFAYTLGVYQRTVVAQRNIYAEGMANHWFRTSLAAQVAKRPQDRVFQGASNELSTATFQPLLGEVGIKTLIQWKLYQQDDDLALTYVESSQELDVRRWSNSTGHFEFFTAEGAWVTHWETKGALPKGIRIVIQTGNDVRNLLVSVDTRLETDSALEAAYSDN